MHFWTLNPHTGLRQATPACMFWTALNNFGNVDRCKETSPHAVIAHNVAVGLIDSASALLAC